MNSHNSQDQLQRIVEEHARLAAHLESLGKEIQALRSAVRSAPLRATETLEKTSQEVSVRAPAFAAKHLSDEGTARLSGGPVTVPPPLPKKIPLPGAETDLPKQSSPGAEHKDKTSCNSAAAQSDFPPQSARTDSGSVQQNEGVELVLGKVWLVRFGVLLLVVGLVLFANYAYQRIVINLGPLVKWVLLFVGAALPGGLGTFLQRREPLRKFGQALEAGGLAGCFYLFFAAHHVEALRWIDDVLVSGFLLLGWTALMAWLADWRRSELLAGFSLMLAYTACMVTPITAFGLFAVFLLSVAAIFFLLKNGWNRISTLAMLATYGLFALWHYILPAIRGSQSDMLNDLALGCLVSYWGVFTAASFLSRPGALSERLWTAWTLINNASVFLLGAVHLHGIQSQDNALAWWAGTFGIVWLALSFFASRHNPATLGRSAQVYLVSGITALSLALADIFDGVNLAVVFAIESVVLSVLSTLHWRRLYLVLSLIIGSCTALIESINQIFDAKAGWNLQHGALVVVALVVAGAFARRGKSAPSQVGKVSFAAYWFCMLAVAVALMLVVQQSSQTWGMLGMLTVGTLLVGSLPLHRFRELAHVSILATLAGCIGFISTWQENQLAAWHAIVAFILLAATGQAWLRFFGAGDGTVSGQLIVLLVAIAETGALMVSGSLAEGTLRFVPSWAIAVFVLAAKARLVGSAWSGWLALLPLACGAFVVLDHSVSGDGIWWADAMLVIAAGLLRPLSAERKPLGVVPLRDQTIWRAFTHTMRWLAPALTVLLAIAWSYDCLPEEKLTVAWSIGAVVLLGYGMLSRQTIDRLWGLAVLAIAGLRLIFVDIWALGPLARVISFLVLGFVLVTAGFLYNKFSDRLREFIRS